ncbi:MAG: LysM peptidoglycan-binding domain-containing protein [Chitinophagaceae bacterium]|nr:LysM peptidoglycan-binding domain-containing protein [Chitinophagaceae bacterium]
MALQDKYASLISAARAKAVGNLNVTEQDNVLYIDGKVGSSKDKDEIWSIYNTIDPDYRAGDVRLTLEVTDAPTSTEYTVKSGDSLSKIASKYDLKWKDIFEANKDLIKNPDLIQPGWKLKIPVKDKS